MKHFLADFNLAATVADLFVAGTETTANVIRWYCLYMAKFPKIQKKIQSEIDFIVPRDRILNYEDKER